RTLSPLWRYVYRVIGDPADADDIVQEAFCRILSAEVSMLPAEDQRRYVFRIASHLIVDRWRAASRERSVSSRVADGGTGVRPRFDGSDLVMVFRHLQPRDRALLWLAYVEQNSHEEIAASLGVKRSSIKVLLARARARLRDLLTAEPRQTRTGGSTESATIPPRTRRQNTTSEASWSNSRGYRRSSTLFRGRTSSG